MLKVSSPSTSIWNILTLRGLGAKDFLSFRFFRMYLISVLISKVESFDSLVGSKNSVELSALSTSLRLKEFWVTKLLWFCIYRLQLTDVNFGVSLSFY